jgi:uncharacterized protein (UPF0332 family)
MTPEQEALLKKARDSLRAAGLLADQGMPDFAVSRAYYSILYVAQAFLLGKNLAFSKHSAVIAAFGQHFAKTGIVPAEFHRYLIECEHSRTVADYDTGPGLSAAHAREQIEHAEAFLKLAERTLRA